MTNEDQKGRRKVCPEMAERHEVSPEMVEDDAKSVPTSFNHADLVPTPTYPNETLLESQQPPTMANMAKTSYLPFQEGIGSSTHTPKPNDIAIDAITPKFCEEPPHISSDKSRGGGGTSCINTRKGEEGATCLNRAKHVLRGLKGEGDISWLSGDEENCLPVLQDPGGVPPDQGGATGPWWMANPFLEHPGKGGQRDVDGEMKEVAVIRAITRVV